MSSTPLKLDAQKASPPEILLTVLSGEDKGVAYKLIGEKISIGRSSENDVVINDGKASRNHCRIEKRSGIYWIVDLDSKIGIALNNQTVKQGALKDGDVIRIGDTNLRFGGAPSLTVAAAPPMPPVGTNPTPLSPQTPLSQIKLKGRAQNPFVIVIAVGLILATLLLLKKGPGGKHFMKIKDESAYDQQIEGSNEFNEQQQQAISEKGKDTQQYAEAQAFYLRGFREFRDGNYSRAIQDFEAALALYPTHPLAKRYLDRSRLKNNELITSALERGERDFQNEKYMNAFNEYRTVMLLTNDPKNKNYQLAAKRIDTIQLILTNNR